MLRAEAGLLLALVTYLIIAPLISDVSAPAALTAEIVFGSLGAVGLWFCAHGFKNKKSYGRAPAVLANLIALGVSYYMVSGSFFIVGIPLGLLALITLLSAAFGYSE
ncbi:unannotated protein [freshwater metagenome]|uniref:Unannotated protein n=1 Tax=freshwater metagenome TaxID=449393 RepID=A0A6J6NMZ0_9ZZZZ